MVLNLFKRNTQADPANLLAAEQEMELITTLYNNILETCHKKCINTTYYEQELNKAESVCIDRCVAKYIQVNMEAGKEFAAHMAQQQNQGK